MRWFWCDNRSSNCVGLGDDRVCGNHVVVLRSFGISTINGTAFESVLHLLQHGVVCDRHALVRRIRSLALAAPSTAMLTALPKG